MIVILLPEWLRFLQDWYLALFGFAVDRADGVAARAACFRSADRFKARAERAK